MLFLMLLCVLLAAVLGFSYYAYRKAFFASGSDSDEVPDLERPRFDPYQDYVRMACDLLRSRPCESVCIRSQEGLKLWGRYYHQQDGAPLDICFHGYRSSPWLDFCGGAELSRQLGHNLLLADQRAHGKSEGHTIAFGIRERWDVMSWIEYALDRFGPDTKIFLYGVSMGASTVLMASDLGLPAAVKGIVADCPYSAPKDIILRVAEHWGYAPKLIWPFVKLGARVYGGFDVQETDACRAVTDTQTPILLLHGQADRFVPCQMSEQICRANPQRVRYFTFPNAGHGLSLPSNPDRYQRLVSEFVSRALDEDEAADIP